MEIISISLHKIFSFLGMEISNLKIKIKKASQINWGAFLSGEGKENHINMK